jgi:hypothetical protein
MRSANLVLRFLLEMANLAALAYWGATVTDGLSALALAIATPLLAALVWARFIGPKAPRRLEDPTRLVLELAVFATGAIALLAAGRPELAAGFAALVTISEIAMFALGQRGA